jgi:hypothetical protein
VRQWIKLFASESLSRHAYLETPHLSRSSYRRSAEHRR